MRKVGLIGRTGAACRIVAMLVGWMLAGTVAAVGGAAPAPNAGAAMHRLLDDYDRYLDTTDPDIAASRHHVPATAWPDNTPMAAAARFGVLAGLQRRLAAIPAASLAGEDRLNHDLLAWRIETDVEGHRFDQDRIPFTGDEGFFLSALYDSETTPIRTEADGAAWIARMRAVPVTKAGF